MKIFWNQLKKYRKLLALTLVLAAINQVFSLLDPQIFRLIIDNYASRIGELAMADFLWGVGLLLLGTMGVALVSRIAKNFQDYYVTVISQNFGASLYEKSVGHTLSLPYEVFEDQRSGEILQVLSKARLDSQVLITSFINTVFVSFVGIIFVTIYALWVHWLVALMYVITIPVIGFSTFLISRKVKKLQQAVIIEQANLAGSTTETLRNVALVKSLGLEDQEIKRLNLVNQLILKLDLKKAGKVRVFSFIQGTLINAVRSGLMFVMLFLMVQGEISLGEFFSLLFYSFFIFNPLSEFGTVATNYQEARASYERLEKILDLPSAPKPDHPVTISGLNNITFDQVDFSYDSAGSHDVLRGINLDIKTGQTVAFVGPSGSGKSTIIKLLVGLYQPTKGQLKYNTTDSRQIDYDQLRRRIGLVAQDTQLFAGTIRDNLLFVSPTATDAECVEVMELAAVDGLLTRSAEGLNAKIGEGGLKLSGGERQRLAIARALLRHPDILIFDEATSSLDSLTEKEITDTITKINKSKPELIMILIAHRLSTISHADVIYVLERGAIIESGDHQQLLDQSGLYAALWRQQSAQD